MEAEVSFALRRNFTGDSSGVVSLAETVASDSLNLFDEQSARFWAPFTVVGRERYNTDIGRTRTDQIGQRFMKQTEVGAGQRQFDLDVVPEKAIVCAAKRFEEFVDRVEAAFPAVVLGGSHSIRTEVEAKILLGNFIQNRSIQERPVGTENILRCELRPIFRVGVGHDSPDEWEAQHWLATIEKYPRPGISCSFEHVDRRSCDLPRHVCVASIVGITVGAPKIASGRQYQRERSQQSPLDDARPDQALRTIPKSAKEPFRRSRMDTLRSISQCYSFCCQSIVSRPANRESMNAVI